MKKRHTLTALNAYTNSRLLVIKISQSHEKDYIISTPNPY